MKTYLLGVPIDNLSRDEVRNKIKQFLREDRSHYIVTPNPEFLVIAQRDSEFKKILNKADLALADGFGLILAARILGIPLKYRITGVDLLEEIIKVAEQQNCSVKHFGVGVYFLGAGEGIAMTVAQKMKSLHPPLRVAGAQAGFKNNELKVNKKNLKLEVDAQINKKVLDDINQTQADILFVAFGQVKQEKWIAQNLPFLPSVKLAIGVGGAFDFISGKVRRAPKWLRSLGLEWFWRLLIQPWRLPRIFQATIGFKYQIIKWQIVSLLRYRENVVACVFRKGGNTQSLIQILLLQRADDPHHWQFPQGGVDKDENTVQAVQRELKEELGTEKFEIIGKTKENVYKYNWKKKDAYHKHPYRGQKQTLFFVEFLGQDSDLKLSDGIDDIFIGFKWVRLEELLKQIHPMRQPLAKIVLEYFKN